MTKPRQEFLGPITKLAAVESGGGWVSDGLHVVDGYGAEIHNVTMVLNSQLVTPTTGDHKGSFWVNDDWIPTTPMFTDSAGNTITLGAAIPLGTSNTVYWSNGATNSWTNNLVIGPDGGAGTIVFGAHCAPYFGQADSLVSGNGVQFSIHAQSVLASDSTSIGGGLWLGSGSGGGGDGEITINSGHGLMTLWSNSFITLYAPKIRHSTRTEIAELGAFDGNSSIDAVTLQCVDNKIVATSKAGYGSCTIAPKAYEGITYRTPRQDKQFGNFQLTGTAETKTLTFSTAIHNFAMPASSVLVGTFMIGWMGDGSYSAGGAMKFLFTITSDVSGNIDAFYCSISDNHGTPGTTVSLTAGSDPTPTHGDSMWMLPVGSHTPLMSIVIPASPTTSFSFTLQANYNATPSAVAKYFWSIEYGWGTNT